MCQTSLRPALTDQPVIDLGATVLTTPVSLLTSKIPCAASCKIFQAFLHVMKDLYTSDTLFEVCTACSSPFKLVHFKITLQLREYYVAYM